MCIVLFIVTLHYEFVYFISIVILCAFVFLLLRNGSNFQLQWTYAKKEIRDPTLLLMKVHVYCVPVLRNLHSY